MDKNQLRETYKKKRAALTDNQIEDLSIAIANQLLAVDIWNKKFYHIFLSIETQKEVDTSYILSILQGKDKEVLIPKSDFKTGLLTNFLLTDNTAISVNKYGIPEPIDGIEIPTQKIDVVFIPLLAYDEKGNRIGYGKGFYDRFLASCGKDVVKIGLSFFPPEEYIDDITEEDIPLDACVTPEKTYRF
ncbi:5-formyltetrahydrofolate cyclo-ligase [Galbibacter sp. EGI 63066]|uniref:5-formyltetrahydrofolate cyclo-ligase n=1 Tax=Galbibacter sp. EGI 63066 TaxID=2993559 RepID=UPI0022487F37|nr:5-formyltetrahydrofolate cyclo-ligase [Galbibacter sp. EGI 63066]MCX2680567.1 5-formyltetrahydrofolate cyclo-ligase [Galbibacter sp. EGI 63066]